MATFDLPEKFDDLPNKLQYWPAPPGSPEEGLGMLRILTPDIVANAARTQIQTGERVCLQWGIENLNPPGKTIKAPYPKSSLLPFLIHRVSRIWPQTL